jgi:hypothetical protein
MPGCSEGEVLPALRPALRSEGEEAVVSPLASAVRLVTYLEYLSSSCTS